MKKIISLITVLCLTILLGAFTSPVYANGENIKLSVATKNSVTQTDKYKGWKTFTNSNGGYSFKYPLKWNASIDKSNVKNSLFGGTKSGFGTVTISSFDGTLDEFLNSKEENTDIHYLTRTKVTINGVQGIRTKTQFPHSGYSVVLKKGKKVYEIMMRIVQETPGEKISYQKNEDVVLFDKLVESFVLSKNTKQLIAQTNKYKGWKTFTSQNGGYSFKYPSKWNASVNKYSTKNSLFGAKANDENGEGGVEVTKFTGNMDEYLNYMEQNVEIEYLTRKNVTVNGISGIRAKYKGSVVSGYVVILKKGDNFYNIYTLSQKTKVVTLFNKLVKSFVLLN
jgi:hypothetical protein